VGLDASSALNGAGADADHVLRSKTTDDLRAYLENSAPPETAWLSPDRQHEEAWFLGLRMNQGVDIAALEQEFGARRVGAAVEVAQDLVEDELLIHDDGRIRLTPMGRLLSNNVFQEFLGISEEPGPVTRAD
jgi:oxygen-independent coproporphyrinogen-3 oxidase